MCKISDLLKKCIGKFRAVDIWKIVINGFTVQFVKVKMGNFFKKNQIFWYCKQPSLVHFENFLFSIKVQ